MESEVNKITLHKQAEKLLSFNKEEEKKMKETKQIRFMRYISVLRKEGLINAREAQEMVSEYGKTSDKSAIMEKLLFLDAKEKSEWFADFITQIENDPVLN